MLHYMAISSLGGSVLPMFRPPCCRKDRNPQAHLSLWIGERTIAESPTYPTILTAPPPGYPGLPSCHIERSEESPRCGNPHIQAS